MVETPVICVVDDDVSVRRALSRLLQAAGYQVEALDSAAAVSYTHLTLPTKA